jgi:hypothetical protein
MFVNRDIFQDPFVVNVVKEAFNISFQYPVWMVLFGAD